MENDLAPNGAHREMEHTEDLLVTEPDRSTGEVVAEHVCLHQVGVRRIEARQASLEQCGVTIAHAEQIEINQGGIMLARAGELTVNQGGTFLVVADQAQVEDASVLLLAARQVSGNVRVLLNIKGAAVVGLVAGLVAGIVRLLGQRLPGGKEGVP